MLLLSTNWRSVVCLLLTAALPAWLAGQDTGGAMLHHTGGVLLNGSAAPLSIAIFPDSHIETPPNTAASIDLIGTRITINPDTEVDFEGDEVDLQRGSVFVQTSQAFRVRAGCLLATPAETEATQYNVSYRDTWVTVHAFIKDVNMDSRSRNVKTASTSGKSERVSVHQGEQKSREDKCAAGMIRSTVPGAQIGILNSPWAVGVGAAAVGIITCIALCRGDEPASPSSFKR